MRNERALLEDLFSNSFRLEKYIEFIQLLSKGTLFIKRNLSVNPKIGKEFNSIVESFIDLGMYRDSKKKIMKFIVVKIRDNKSVENGRTLQRNFVKSYFLKHGCDSALVAFYNNKNMDWRLSFIKLDYSYKNLKLGEEITPAKRFSFLLGKDEKHHTPVTRFLLMLNNGENLPTLEDIEEVFNIEVVTKEFFEKYCDLYLMIKKELDRQESFKTLSELADVKSDEFAKKLMGQLVFLYFLQKKGWLGVEANPKIISKEETKNLFKNKSFTSIQVFNKVYILNGDVYVRDDERIVSLSNEEVEGLNKIFINTLYDARWGTGDKNFIRSMYEKARKEEKNFFKDYLEPIFYNALNDKRGGETYFKYLNCKIPFLNGGLFQPISNNYDYRKNLFTLDNDIFSNKKKTNQGDIGCGVLDVFDRYAFTIKEDEPLEKDVAVDPEMLGKVFENLLDVKDRKKKGAFYTPREIVHYMCQESLINYLQGEAELSYDEAEALIRYGDILLDFDMNTETTIEKNFKMPKKVRNNARKIDDKLENVKIAEPAVGSGAFPLGMVNEIVRARTTLTYYMLDDYEAINRKIDIKGRQPYELKLKTIKRCIHAVDIERSAVDITKLRLWLSLVIEENDFFEVTPLPNLDYNIMVGNSLIEEFQGVKLFDESILNSKSSRENKKEKVEQLTLLSDEKTINETEIILDEIYNLQEKFFYANDTDEKVSLKKNIESLEWLLIEKTVKKENREDLLEEIKEYKRTNSKPYFLWKLNFARVFREKGGFDIVIGNPPYIGFHNVPDKEYYKTKYYSANGKYDFYVLFIEKGIELLKENGRISYICPSYFYKRNYGKNIRKLILENMSINYIADFQDSQMFESALTYTCIFMATKHNEANNKISIVDKNLSSNTKYCINQKDLCEPLWNLENKESRIVLERIRSKCKYTLEDITKNISQGIVTGNNNVFCIDQQLIKECNISMKFLKPVYKGKDIRNGKIIESGEYVFYPYIFRNGKMVLIQEEYIREEDNNLYQYLLSNKRILLDREYFIKSNKFWYELWNPRKRDHFEAKKFVFSELNNHNDFVIVDECFYSDSACGMELKNEYTKYYEYLKYYLNTDIMTYYFSKITVPKANGYFVYKNAFLSKLPIYIPTDINSVDYSNFDEWLTKELDLGELSI